MPLCLLVLVVTDAIRVWMGNSDPSVALASSHKILWIIKGLALSVFLIAVVPVTFAPWMARSRGRHDVTRVLRHQSIASSIMYITLCIILGYCVVFCHNLERLVGNAYVEGKFGPAFSSLFLEVVERWPPYVWFVLSMFFGFLGATKMFLDWPKTKQPDWSAYVSRLELIALQSRFAPRHGRHQLNFDSGCVAPLLEGVQKEWVPMLRKYQELVPGSRQAAAYLEQAWATVKDLLRNNFQIREQPRKQVRLASSTGRGLEVALNETCSGSCVLLSPYEHPTEHIVARAQHEIRVMQVSPRFHDEPWQQQKKAIVQWIETQLSNEPMAFVISEVCWATGRHIRIDELIPEIRTRTETDGNLVVVIDGAHAVGNLARMHPVKLCDAYVFSGHKWLLAPEPCGLVLTNKAIPTYDLWVDELPNTTVGAAQVCGLLASLRFLNSLAEDQRMQRSYNLRNRFRKELEDAFEIVGESSGLEETSMLSVRPAQDRKWNVNAELFRQRLLHKNIHATVIEPQAIYKKNTEEFWVRVSIAWFLDWRAIRDLTSFLRDSVTKAQSAFTVD